MNGSRGRWHPLPQWFRRVAAGQHGAVLLETARFDEENYRSFLFFDPVCELRATSPDEVEPALAQVDTHVAQGRYVAGFVAYECGEALYRIAPRQGGSAAEMPLLCLYVFAAPLVFDHRDGTIHGPLATCAFDESHGSLDPAAAACITEARLGIEEEIHAEKICQVQRYLAAGDSYQVNFTDRVSGSFTGSPEMLYQELVERQPVSYAALMRSGDHHILSLSPELFYRMSDQTISVRPMKGTWPRGATPEEDAQAAGLLQHDEKNRAEHVTIVDLLRNDLGAVCEIGSVRVRKLMQVERYHTLHQMTSTIAGRVDGSITPSRVFRALFPSGSITGAPKRRTMQIIRELERTPRGVYTGAIGWFGPEREACFNVAIRTLVVRDGRFTLGVGGGITADSDARQEYKECQLKASFLTQPRASFELIETMRASRGSIPLLAGHLERLSSSAAYFEIEFDEQALKTELANTLRQQGGVDSRVRVTLAQNGHFDICAAILDPAAWSGRVVLSAERTMAGDVFLRHKTTNRHGYTKALEEAQRDGFDEVLFLNRDGFVTEGAISNIFLLVDGAIVTPSASCGVLAGVQRRQNLLDLHAAVVRPVTLADVQAADRIWMCNALRGNRPVTSLVDRQGKLLWRQAPAVSTRDALAGPGECAGKS